jgi:hypothetical protein
MPSQWCDWSSHLYDGVNLSASTFEPMGYSASTIYAVFHLSYIPVGHALQCLLVFGWPNDYVLSLMSNAPIGLAAMAIGTIRLLTLLEIW